MDAHVITAARARTMRVQEEEASEVATTAGRRFTWRLEYTLLIGVGFLLTLFALAFFYFSADISNLKSYGYVGLFFINLIGAASIFLPSPAAASVVGGGAVLEDFLGIPAPVWVGLVAGIGEACGEMVGYAAGYGGRVVVENQPGYDRIHRWMDRHGTITMFLMSIVPNPLFDVAGIAAGAVEMPLRNFFLAVWAGKTLKNLWLAGVGAGGLAIIESLA